MEGGREAAPGSDGERNAQSGLNCTGRAPSRAGRATTGPMARQRSMRRKPLLRVIPSMVGWDRGGKLLPDLVRLHLLDWRARERVPDGGSSFLFRRPVQPGVEHAA